MAKQNFTYAKGKRRTASARVRLFKGKGDNVVNEISVEKYFPGVVNRSYWIKPFDVTGTIDKYYFSARVVGSGIKGQLDAVVHGVARALAEVNPEKYRLVLRRAGLLTRDARFKERRMVGTGGKSRRKKQSPKR